MHSRIALLSLLVACVGSAVAAPHRAIQASDEAFLVGIIIR